ncbi:MAG: hypothetical protein JWQ81_4930 [Amycolatopsis sp.]|uniref:hypothetical protein n=1 Tax=Amycolatopsis sp. TaxID=37632 RepID=UPI00262386A0|nr:hypothetical protein [Amycolatopsis sp.]MCU1684191.1 hypothetical protein [Amycolatopsis sp.]
MVRVQDQAWPGNVLPEEDHEFEQAMKSLLVRAHWLDAPTREIRTELRKWFEAGYSVDAILVALDRTPANVRQRPRDKNEDLHRYLRSRLRAWYEDDPDALLGTVVRPPRPGMSMRQWWTIARRNEQRSAVRKTAPVLTEAGRKAREQALEQSRSKRRDPVSDAREKDRTNRAALDSLLLPGAPVPPIPAAPALLPPTGRTAGRMVAAYAGSRAAIAHDPRVRRLVERLVGERRGPTEAERQVLANAVKDARRRAALGALEAAGSEVGDDVGLLSDEGWRILTYLDRAMATSLPLDAMMVVLDMSVRDAAGDPA